MFWLIVGLEISLEIVSLKRGVGVSVLVSYLLCFGSALNMLCNEILEWGLQDSFGSYFEIPCSNKSRAILYDLDGCF